MYIDKSIYWLMFSLFVMIVFLAIMECILKHTKFKPSRKSFSIIICLITFIIVYTLLFKYVHGNNWIGDYINSFVAIGTIALAVFAWMAYRYATNQYINQKKIDRAIDIAYDVYSKIDHDLLSLKEDLDMYNIYVKQINKERNNINDPDSAIAISHNLKMLANYVSKILDKVGEFSDSTIYWIFKLNLLDKILANEQITKHIENIKKQFDTEGKDTFLDKLNEFESKLIGIEDHLEVASKMDSMKLGKENIPTLEKIDKQLYGFTIEVIDIINQLAIMVFKPE